MPEGERYAYSPLTEQWYVVTEWEELDGEGQIKAKEKEPIMEAAVPDEVIEAHYEGGSDAEYSAVSR